MERTLTITLNADNQDEFTIEIYDHESGDIVNKIVPFSPDEHPEFNDWIGNEMYDWATWMIENLEDKGHDE